MTVEEFYAFCQDRRNNGNDGSKEIAILTIWNFMYEHQRTKEEIERYIDDRSEDSSKPSRTEAYTWLKGVLEG